MIKFLGHASIYIKTEETSIVTDPWFSKSGAFLNSWFQFPDNTEIDFSWKDDLDYVCISHEHQDHFDIEFLKTLNKKTKIVIPKYKNRRFYDEIKRNFSNDVIEVNSKEKCLLGDVEFYPIIQIPGWDDSGLLFKTPQETILDLNDMKLSDKNDIEWIKSNFDIDYLFVQFSGASWYPHVYPYSSEEKIKFCQSKKINKFKNVINVFKELKAKVLLPCAGPPCFLSDEHFDINLMSENGFPNQKDFYEYYQKDVCILLPEDEINMNMDYKEISENNLNRDCFKNKKMYLEKYKKRRTDLIKKNIYKIKKFKGSFLNKMKNHFVSVIQSNKYFRDEIGGKVLFEIYDNSKISEKIIVDFSSYKYSVCKFDDLVSENYFYTFKIENKFLNLILDEKMDWETFFLSMRFKVFRNPDKYNEHLTVLLKYPYESSLKRYEEYKKSKKLDETFILQSDGKKYECQKYCPHAFGDLSKGEVLDGKVVCPLHKWEFSLSDGSCVNNDSKIKVTNLGEKNVV